MSKTKTSNFHNNFHQFLFLLLYCSIHDIKTWNGKNMSKKMKFSVFAYELLMCRWCSSDVCSALRKPLVTDVSLYPAIICLSACMRVCEYSGDPVYASRKSLKNKEGLYTARTWGRCGKGSWCSFTADFPLVFILIGPHTHWSKYH